MRRLMVGRKHSGGRGARAVLAISFGLLIVVAAATPAAALTIFLDQGATWRYINATPGTNVGTPAATWYTPGFDDSSWSSGRAPFTSSTNTFGVSGTFGGDLANVNTPYAPGTAPALPDPCTFGTDCTRWDVDFDPYLRAHFTLLAPTALTVWIAVDNGIGLRPSDPPSGVETGMFLNGVKATAGVSAEGTANRWEHVFDIPAALTVAGDNVIALQLEDHGGATGFALVISGDDAATNPAFATPEPSTWLLLLTGAAALGGAQCYGRRRTRG